MERAVCLQVELESESTPALALDKAVINIAKEFNSHDGITARRAVIYLLEATTLIPGVFNIEMLQARQRLQDYLHGPQHCQSFKMQTLEYAIAFAPQKYRAPSLKKTSVCASKGTQTEIINPTQGELLNFTNPQYSLEWVLKA